MPSQANALAHGVPFSVCLPQAVAAPFTAPSVSPGSNIDGLVVFMQSTTVNDGTLIGRLETATVATGPWVAVTGGTFATVTAPAFAFQAITVDGANLRRFIRYIADGTTTDSVVCVQAIGVRKYA